MVNSTHDILDFSICSPFLRAFDTLLRMCGNLIPDPTQQFSKLIFVRKKSFFIDLVRRVKFMIPISKKCLVIYERFKRRKALFFLELSTVEKCDVLEREFWKRLGTLVTFAP